MTSRLLYILAVLLLLTPANMANAEKKQPFAQDLRIGARGGVNFTKVAFRPQIKESYALKYSGGFVARWVTERHFGLQAELGYSMRGWEREFISDRHIEAGHEYSRELNYLELPLMTHIYFGKKAVRCFFNLGPQASLFLSEKEKTNINVSTITDPSDFQEVGKPIENKFDWGICGGGGFEVFTRTGSYIVEARYYYGLGNIFGSSRDVEGTGENSKRKDPFSQSSMSVISVNFTYLIPIPLKGK